ncbi:MAG: hypothetical protein U0640_11530 [Phycisphaerales bacterium]
MQLRTHLLTALSCLLFGVLVTVIVSWAIPIRNYYGKLFFASSAEALPNEWPIDVPSNWPSAPNDASMTSRWGFELRYYEWTSYGTGTFDPSTPEKRRQYAILIRRAGWPFRAMASVEKHESDFIAAIDSSSWTWTVPGFRNRRLEKLQLPFKPLFPGFALNVLIIAGIPFVAVCMLKKRRFTRLARTRCCMKCAYPVGQLPTCPECGTPTQLP